MYKLSRGLLDLNTDELLVPSQELRTRDSDQFKYRVLRATKDIFKYLFLSQNVNWVEQSSKGNSLTTLVKSFQNWT